VNQNVYRHDDLLQIINLLIKFISSK